ncbi:methyl-accepting chemotaxis protein [Paraburkholderia phenazinium]|uniref:Methyl-accepting chemotaxis protein-1, serine sensor receptor n=1 Tax=Paraburkholderia phenazinium TaxID=60549 RepID=A0A1G8FZY3_9BURK|nr:methyl-accepting chemotaxis protein [Paraburkholderia phenazinium]SDH87556.1 methyl-accepting chemotaxis protein-1, serine sensor receptor [Paraburkholderia phenazinium]
MNIKTMSVKAKLYSAFGTLTIVVMVVAGMSVKALSDANARFSGYVSGIDARANMTQQVRTAVDRRAIAARNMALVTRPDDFQAEKDAEAQAQQDVQTNLAKLNQLLASGSDVSEQGRDMVKEINRIEGDYTPVAQAIVALAVANKRDEAVAKIDSDCRPLLAALIKATDTYQAYARTRAEQMVEAAAEQYALQRAILIGTCVVAIGLSLLLGLLIARGLIRSLGAEPGVLSELAQRVAGGDLRAVTGAAQAPEGSVLSSMGRMQASLVELIGRVRTAADSIATGSSQIASGNLDLSSRTEQQASSLQETASSMEELTSTVKQNAENSQQASVLSANASDVAVKGNHVVSQVVQTMGEISTSSTKIADITSIIEGIAFQTNILALNAAVEAARAGEQGRGFAVVASEVRSLAQRSSSAAKEIKDLIGESVAKIQGGSERATEAGKTMSEVTQAVARVTDIMGEIAAASTEQSRGIELVNQAIAQMDSVTQQNAALVEQAAAASKSLEGQGHQLNEAIAFFKLDGASGFHA